MTTMINFRADDSDLAVLAQIRRPGESRTDVLRRSLRAALTLEAREQMRAEAEFVAADPDDLDEARAVQQEMADLRAW